MLQNGLTILIFIWSLMGMVNFSHDSMTSVMTDFPVVDGVFVSQLIRYAGVCSKYEDILFKGSILVAKLVKQGYSSHKLQTTFRKLYVQV